MPQDHLLYYQPDGSSNHGKSGNHVILAVYQLEGLFVLTHFVFNQLVD